MAAATFLPLGPRNRISSGHELVSIYLIVVITVTRHRSDSWKSPSSPRTTLLWRPIYFVSSPIKIKFRVIARLVSRTGTWFVPNKKCHIMASRKRGPVHMAGYNCGIQTHRCMVGSDPVKTSSLNCCRTRPTKCRTRRSGIRREISRGMIPRNGDSSSIWQVLVARE